MHYGITLCMRVFYEQNVINSHLRVVLKLEILDALMLMKLCHILVEKYEGPTNQPS